MITLLPIYTEKEFSSLESIWNEMLNRSNIRVNRVFFTFEFMRLWWRYFSSDYELLILLAKDGKEPVGIIPLVRHRNGRFNEIRILGDCIVDYQDFILTRERGNCIELVLSFLSENVLSWDIFSLDNVPHESPNFVFFEKQAKSRKRWVRLEEFGNAPYIKINTGWNTFYGNVHKGMKADTRRQLQRLEERGKLRFCVCQNIEEITTVMNKLFEYKNNRYKNTGKKGVYQEKRMRDFLLNIAITFFEKRWADVSCIKLNENIIAIHFGSIYQNKFYYWIPAFDYKYENFSPSRILLYELVRAAFKNGFAEFDFGFGQETYKYHWTRQERPLHRFIYFNKTAKGLLLREWFHSLRGLVKKSRISNAIFKSIEHMVTKQ